MSALLIVRCVECDRALAAHADDDAEPICAACTEPTEAPDLELGDAGWLDPSPVLERAA